MDQDSVINALSQSIYKNICLVYRECPQWLVEKYRKYNWDSSDFEAKLITQLRNRFSKISNPDNLVMNAIQTLHVFLLPDFFASNYFATSLDNIRQSIEIGSIFQSSQATLTQSLLHHSECAILLLDTENLFLDIDTERFLSTLCQYPIQIKIAFANWRSQGKKDIEFHNRGYELIHVPPGKDSADVKMATVGSSIFVHYPTAREVFVCSSDSVMIHLCNTLKTHGLTVYLVRRSGNRITVINQKTKESKTHVINSYIPSLEDFAEQVKKIIQEKQEKSSNYWIKLSDIRQDYKKNYDISVKEVVNFHFPGQEIKTIFSEAKKDFVIYQATENAEIYLAIFKINESQENKVIQQVQDAEEIQSKEQLEKVLTTLVKEIIKKEGLPSVSHVVLATEFNKRYRISITKLLKRLNLTSRYLQFLQSCPGLVVEKVDKDYKVSILERENVFNSKENLEKTLMNLIRNMCKESEQDSISISFVASVFRKEYNKSVTEVIKELKLAKKYLDFLKNCQGLTIYRENNQHKVRIVSSDE